MAEITAQLDLEITRLKSALGKANGQLDSFAKKGESSGRQLGSGMASGLKSVLLPAIAALGIGAGIAAIFRKSLKEAAANEQLQVSMEVLVGDASEATALMDRLRQEAATTPLQFEDLGDAARKLLAFGSSAATVPDELRRIGDIASGIGAPIGELAELYGKARTQGTLMAVEINQLTRRGIPILKEFADQFGVSESEVKKLGSEGKITFQNLEQAFVKLTSQGGLFANMLEKQSQTLAGKWSTLKDNVALLYLEFGKPIGDALKPALDGAIERVTAMRDLARSVGETLADGIDFAMGAVDTLTLREGFELAGLVLKKAFQDAVNIMWRGIQRVREALGDEEFTAMLGRSAAVLGDGIRDSLLAGVAAVFDAMKEFPGIGKRFADAASKITQPQIDDIVRHDARKNQVAFANEMLAGTGVTVVDDSDKLAAAAAAARAQFQREEDEVFDTEDTGKEIARMMERIQVAADARKDARTNRPGDAAPAPAPEAPSGASMVPQLASGPGAQVGLQSALSYLSGGNLQVEANTLLRQIVRNTAPKTETRTRAPVPGGAVGMFG